MKCSLKSIAAVSAFSLLAIAPLVLSANPAAAQTKGFDGSYIGVGPSFGATDGGQGNDAALYNGNVQGRYAIPQTPVSLRAAALFNDKSTSLVPALTVDLPVAQNTNVYTGVGYSFITNNAPTALGNRDSVVVTLGAESEVSQNVVLYGDAKYGINAYKNSPASALSFQAGLGYRF